MNQNKFGFSIACIAAAALLVATPVVGQLHNHPVMALPAGDAAGSTFVGAEFARGLNDNSGKQNSFAAGVGRAMERVSVMGMAGYVASDTDGLTLGAAVAAHLLSDDSMPVQVSVQGGVGWISEDIGTESVTILNLPIGVAIQARPSGNGPSVVPWVMPRLNISRTGELGTIPSNAQTDIGASGGVSFTSESGAGVHVSGDWINVEGGSPFGFSIGGHYVIP